MWTFSAKETPQSALIHVICYCQSGEWFCFRTVKLPSVSIKSTRQTVLQKNGIRLGRCDLILESPESMKSYCVVPFIYCLSLIMLFFLFLSFFAGIDPAIAMMVCLALLMTLLFINGFAYFIRYIFCCFCIYKIQAHNSLVNIDFQEVMFWYNCHITGSLIFFIL